VGYGGFVAMVEALAAEGWMWDWSLAQMLRMACWLVCEKEVVAGLDAKPWAPRMKSWLRSSAESAVGELAVVAPVAG